MISTENNAAVLNDLIQINNDRMKWRLMMQRMMSYRLMW